MKELLLIKDDKKQFQIEKEVNIIVVHYTGYY